SRLRRTVPRFAWRRSRWVRARGGTLLEATRPGELSGLEAFLAEDRAPLSRLKGHRRFLAACRARGDGFHALAGDAAAGRPAGTFALARLAPLGFVLEVLVGEKLLLASGPHELRAAIDAPEDPVLELHRSLPRPGRFPISVPSF